MKQKLQDFKHIMSYILVVIVCIASMYIYKHYDLKWYYLLLLLIISLSIILELGLYHPYKKAGDMTGIYFSMFLASICSFWIQPTLHRIITYIVILIGVSSLPGLKNHEKNNDPKREHVESMVGVLFLFSFIYYAVNTQGLTRWVNIGFAIISAIGVAYDQEHIEGVKEFDRQEDYFDSTSFGKASKYSFNTVLHDKGLKAEYEASTWLYQIESYHKVLYNVFTPSYKNRFVSEIDAIVICRNGIKSLEIKNQSKKWMISGEGKNDVKAYNQYGTLITEEQRNPFFQNRIHMQNLAHLLKQSNIQVIKDSASQIGGYVVFGSQTLGWNIDNVDQGYCKYQSIGRLLNESCNNRSVLSDSEISLIYEYLLPYQNNAKLSEEHKRQVGYR